MQDYAGDGDDILCAAVSALTFNAVNSIEEFTEDAYQVEQAEDGGYLKVLFPEGLSERAALLMDSHGSRNRGISRLNTEMNILPYYFEEV